jgi:long-subunit fatty acid transport protein
MMKKLLVALALFPMVATANELSVGTFELAGDSDLNFRSGSVDVKNGGSTDTTNYGLGATGLYYVTPNVGVGAALQYAYAKESAGGVDTSLSTLLIGPAVGVDFSVAPQFSLFGRGAVGYASSTQTQTAMADINPTGYGFSLAAGVKYFPVKAFSLDAGLGYDWVKLTKSPLEVTTSGFGVNLGVSVYFNAK